MYKTIDLLQADLLILKRDLKSLFLRFLTAIATMIELWEAIF
jgi:hypothetical protein